MARAWDVKKPFLVAPAMNVLMWEHPHTARQLAELKQLNIQIIDTIAIKQMCGDIGNVLPSSVDRESSPSFRLVQKCRTWCDG